MAFPFDPRGDLPPPTIQPTFVIQSRSSLSALDSRNSMRKLSSLSLSTRPRIKPCYDWIFSSASTVHVALDLSAFKEYTPFESYVLTLSDHRQLQVKGIGSVELKIRRNPTSRENHTILLTNVLHIPSWLCNIFSDVYFNSGHDFEHSWGSDGVQFFRREDKDLRSWGYTESFCSLDRLVLAKRPRDSRSPMAEDKEREVFSINVTWPYAQRKRWEAFSSQKEHRPRALSESGLPIVKFSGKENVLVKKNGGNAGMVQRRATLSDINANTVKRGPSKRVSSLKATISRRDLSHVE